MNIFIEQLTIITGRLLIVWNDVKECDAFEEIWDGYISSIFEYGRKF